MSAPCSELDAYHGSASVQGPFIVEATLDLSIPLYQKWAVACHFLFRVLWLVLLPSRSLIHCSLTLFALWPWRSAIEELEEGNVCICLPRYSAHHVGYWDRPIIITATWMMKLCI